MAAPVMGLAPTFPLMTEAGTSVTPVLVRMAKVPAVPRLTGACAVKGTFLVVKVQVTGEARAMPVVLTALVVMVAT